MSEEISPSRPIRFDGCGFEKRPARKTTKRRRNWQSCRLIKRRDAATLLNLKNQTHESGPIVTVIKETWQTMVTTPAMPRKH